MIWNEIIIMFIRFVIRRFLDLFSPLKIDCWVIHFETFSDSNLFLNFLYLLIYSVFKGNSLLRFVFALEDWVMKCFNAPLLKAYFDLAPIFSSFKGNEVISLLDNVTFGISSEKKMFDPKMYIVHVFYWNNRWQDVEKSYIHRYF